MEYNLSKAFGSAVSSVYHIGKGLSRLLEKLEVEILFRDTWALTRFPLAPTTMITAVT